MPFRTVVHVFEQPSQTDPHPARHGRDGVLPEQVPFLRWYIPDL